MRVTGMKKFYLIVFVAYVAFGASVAAAGEYWGVRCKNGGYGVDFNVEAGRAFIIFTTDEGGTIPAASTANIVLLVNRPDDKHAIFDFGSATKIGVNVSRVDRAIIYRVLQGKTYPVCDANASIRQ